jgi:hypothetical protein
MQTRESVCSAIPHSGDGVADEERLVERRAASAPQR